MSASYYRAERNRYPELDFSPCGPGEALAAVQRLCSHLGLPPVKIVWSQRRRSHGYRPWVPARGWPGTRIRFNRQGLNWLAVVHELAHYWQDLLQVQTLQTQGSELLLDNRAYVLARDSDTGHDCLHTKLVQRLAHHVRTQGWHLDPGGVLQ